MGNLCMIIEQSSVARKLFAQKLRRPLEDHPARARPSRPTKTSVAASPKPSLRFRPKRGQSLNQTFGRFFVVVVCQRHVKKQIDTFFFAPKQNWKFLKRNKNEVLATFCRPTVRRHVGAARSVNLQSIFDPLTNFVLLGLWL